MANLKEVKNRINSVQSTQQITKAMKLVAASKLRKAQDRILHMPFYANRLNAIMRNILRTLEGEAASPYEEKRTVEKVLLVAVTSDRGLCGAFNANVWRNINRMLEGELAEHNANGNVTIMCIGKKGYDFFRSRHDKVIGDFYELFADLNFDEARRAAEMAMEGFINKEFDQVTLVYNAFKNVATQVLTVEQLLPLGDAGKGAEEGGGEEAEPASSEYIYEPDKETILEMLIPKSLKIQFYNALLQSNASEHGARMTAMDQATDNAGELLKELKLQYNRTRQAAITTELSEIVSGAAALEQGG